MNFLNFRRIYYLLLRIIIFSCLFEDFSVAQVLTDSSLNKGQNIDTSMYFSGDLNLNLCTAAFDGNGKAVLKLLNLGANINSTADGLSALHYAILNGHLDVTKILVLNGADINRPSDEGFTPLIMAVQNGQDEIVDFLCQSSVNTDSTDFFQRTPLMYSISIGSYLITDMLLFYGANSLIKDKEGNDALMIASYSNQPNLANILYLNGANLDSRDNYNNTPLIVASEKGYVEMVDSLLKWGANTELKNKAGYSALTQSIVNSNIEICKRLIKYSANVNDNIRDGIRPLNLVKKNTPLDSLLKSAGARYSYFPDYHEMLIGFDFASNFHDYMNNIHLGIYDQKFFTSLSLGFHTRMAAMKLFMPRSETLWYQYWERRYFIYASADKLFPILKNTTKRKAGISISLKGGYTFGNYRGSSAAAASEWLLVPSAQLFHSGRYHTISIGYEYSKYPCFDLSAHHLVASIAFHFPVQNESANIKDINWVVLNP